MIKENKGHHYLQKEKTKDKMKEKIKVLLKDKMEGLNFLNQMKTLKLRFPQLIHRVLENSKNKNNKKIKNIKKIKDSEKQLLLQQEDNLNLGVQLDRKVEILRQLF